jgi:hypothetical protein
MLNQTLKERIRTDCSVESLMSLEDLKFRNVHYNFHKTLKSLYSLQRASSHSHKVVKCTAVARLGAISAQMNDLGYDASFDRHISCEIIHDAVHSLDLAAPSTAGDPCNCQCCSADMKKEVIDAMEEEERRLEGLCLTCAKQGRFDPRRFALIEERNCGLLNHREFTVQEWSETRSCWSCGREKPGPKKDCEKSDGVSCALKPFKP